MLNIFRELTCTSCIYNCPSSSSPHVLIVRIAHKFGAKQKQKSLCRIPRRQDSNGSGAAMAKDSVGRRQPHLPCSLQLWNNIQATLLCRYSHWHWGLGLTTIHQHRKSLFLPGVPPSTWVSPASLSTRARVLH